MKWGSGINPCVTYDPNRNQLARVIKDALCFQSDGKYSDEVFVALVTPATFKRPDGERRAYQEMFREYDSDRANLRRDLDACRLEKRDRPDWEYPPDMVQRVDRLKLRWPTYEELFAGIPTSPISGGLRRFWEKFGNIP